jgi:hypothetical protein
MLKDAPKAKGTQGRITGPGRGKKNGGAKVEPPLSDAPPTLASVNITKKESSRSQELAAVPEADFEAALAVEPGKELNHNKVLKLAKETRQRGSFAVTVGTAAARAFRAARSQALAAGLDVVDARGGWLWRVRPDGRRKRLRRNEAPTAAVPGTRIVPGSG